mgnify:CR=1 FL=1
MRKIKKRKKITHTSTNSTNKRRKLGINIKIAIILAIIAILLVCYIALGIKYTALVAMLMFIVFGIWFVFTRKGRKRRKLISIILILFFTLGILCLVGFSVFVIYIKGQADPKYEKGNLNTLEMSRIYDKDGNEIAKLGSEKREKVTYDELPEVLVDAIIATEDSRFFQHNGFDAPRFIKATLGQLTQGSEAGGASTLSMQVTKNSFTDPLGQASSGVKGIIRKFEDIYITVFMLEKDYSKEQIIEFYVNNHFLGGNIYGVEEASNAYFGKSVSDLNLSEAAILAGMFKSPNYYRPTTNPKNATARRKTVLYLMRKHGYITKEEEEAANAIPVESLTAEIANSNAFRREKEAEANRLATAAEKVQQAKALQEAYAAEREAELARAERERSTQQANIIVPEEIEKQRRIIEAEAEAEKARVNAKGEADAIFAKMEAEAKGLYEILTKQAAGYDKMVQAAGGDANKAYMLLLLEKLPELVKTQVEAVKGVNIDHVTVWDSGNNGDGKGSTANFVSGLMKSVPPLSDLFDLAGMNLPEYLGKKSSVEDVTPVEEK